MKLSGVLYLALYLLALYRPAMPYIEYILNKDFIAKTLCINKTESCSGKCYLKKQVSKSLSEKNSDSENNSELDFELDKFPFSLIEESTPPSKRKKIKIKYWEIYKFHKDLYFNINLPPPIC